MSKKIQTLGLVVILLLDFSGVTLMPLVADATSVRDSTINTAASGTSISVSAPAGTTAGDLVIVTVVSNGVRTVTDNNGATPFDKDEECSESNQGVTGSLFSRRIQGGDPSTYNFTLSGSDRWSIVAVTFQDPDPSTIYDVVAVCTPSDNGQTSRTVPSITTQTDNAIHVVWLGLDGGGSFTITDTPGGYDVQENGGSNQNQAFATKVITPAGATGDQTFTVSTENGTVALAFAIKDFTPAAAPTRIIRLRGSIHFRGTVIIK